MIVHQKAGHPSARRLDRLDRGVRIADGDDLGIPGREQRSHAVEDRRIVLDAHDQGAAHRRTQQWRGAGDRGGEVDRLRGRHRHRKYRTAARIGVDGDAVVEDTGQPLDDRQSEPEAAGNPRALLEAMELLEDLGALDDRNADAGIVDADLQGLAVAPAADQHTAVRGVFDGIGDEVLQQPTQQRAIGFDRQRTGHEGQFQPLGPRARRKLDLERTHQVADLEARDRGCHGAGIEPRNIQ